MPSQGKFSPSLVYSLIAGLTYILALCPGAAYAASPFGEGFSGRSNSSKSSGDWGLRNPKNARDTDIFDFFDEPRRKRPQTRPRKPTKTAKAREPSPTYRTVCVRLCDGFYWPVSFATPKNRFARDAKICASSCSAQTRLFMAPNSGFNAVSSSAPTTGDSIADMMDASGAPYGQLNAAYLYRTGQGARCACGPQPWRQPPASVVAAPETLSPQNAPGTAAASPAVSSGRAQGVRVTAAEKTRPVLRLVAARVRFTRRPAFTRSLRAAGLHWPGFAAAISARRGRHGDYAEEA